MSGLKVSCVSGVHCHISLCLLLVEVFAIPGEPCYQILKMLSSPPRLPSTAETCPPSLYRLSLSSLYFVSYQMSESFSGLFLSWIIFSTFWYCIYYLSSLLTHPNCCRSCCWGLDFPSISKKNKKKKNTERVFSL